MGLRFKEVGRAIRYKASVTVREFEARVGIEHTDVLMSSKYIGKFDFSVGLKLTNSYVRLVTDIPPYLISF